jgi:hypothetical protein
MKIQPRWAVIQSEPATRGIWRTKWDHAEGCLQNRLSKLPIDSEDLSRFEVFIAERAGVAKAEVRRNFSQALRRFFTTKV